MWTTQLERGDFKMKKIISAVLTAMFIAGAAFAGSTNNVEIGATYGTISYVNKNNCNNHTDVSGWGFTVGNYDELIPFAGVQTTAFFIFPRELRKYNSNGYITDYSSSYDSPFVMSLEAMLMLNVPLGLFDVRVGAGIAYTLHCENRSYVSKSDIVNHYIAVPVSVCSVFHLGSVGLKAGCDIQFVFSNFITENGGTQELRNLNYDTFIFLPYVSATFKF